MTFPLVSNGTPAGTTLIPSDEERIQGESLWWPSGGTSGTAGMLVTGRTALQLSAILATHNTLATDVAVLPLDIYQREDSGGRRKAFEHPASELFGRSPNGETTPIRWCQAWMGHALLGGNGYAEIQRTGRGKPYALHLLDPDSTHTERRGDNLGYRLGNGEWLESANVLHLSGFGWDGQCGYNMISLIKQAVGLGLAAEGFGADYFSNGSEPNGVIETPERLKGPALEEFRNGWETMHGIGNRHRTAILMGGAKFNPTSGDPETSQLVETRKFQVNDVTRPWRVPPQKIGDFSQAHLSNIEASNLDYLMTALMGWLTAIEQEVNLKLVTPAEYRQGFYAEHNVNALLKADITKRFTSYEVALRNGWMSRDEVRARENLNPIGAAKGGDLYTVQSQNIPLDQAGQVPAIPPPVKPPATRSNPHHGPDGKFSAGGGGSGGGGGGGGGGSASDHADTAAKVERANGLGEKLADHADPVGELSKEFGPQASPEWQADAKQRHTDLLSDQATARKDQTKEQAADLKQFDRDQGSETKQFDRDQKSEAKDFHRAPDQPKEDFQATQTKDKADFQAEQHDAKESFLGDQLSDRESLKESQHSERKDLVGDFAIELMEMD